MLPPFWLRAVRKGSGFIRERIDKRAKTEAEQCDVGGVWNRALQELGTSAFDLLAGCVSNGLGIPAMTDKSSKVSASLLSCS